MSRLTSKYRLICRSSRFIDCPSYHVATSRIKRGPGVPRRPGASQPEWPASRVTRSAPKLRSGGNSALTYLNWPETSCHRKVASLLEVGQEQSRRPSCMLGARLVNLSGARSLDRGTEGAMPQFYLAEGNVSAVRRCNQSRREGQAITLSLLDLEGKPTSFTGIVESVDVDHTAPRKMRFRVRFKAA